MVDRFQQAASIQTAIWRTVAEHPHLEESLPQVFKLMQAAVRLKEVEFRRLDREHCVWHISRYPKHSDLPSVSMTTEAVAALDRWHTAPRWIKSADLPVRKQQLLNLAQAENSPWLISLGPPHQLQAVVVLDRNVRGELSESEQLLMECLTDALQAAMDIDARWRELQHRRLAADADRQSLLRRLGRQELDECVVGESTGLQLVMERVAVVCSTSAPVLILGETGTGKEVVARAIHQRSNRREQPFIRVNCGAIPPELIDSQLFGHERGSFTGADRTQLGWFERAAGGTLFLDEIGELPLEAQVRFLRVLQDGLIERIGSHDSIHVDVRIVAATHQDLASMVLAKRFREDLWYRLAVFPILLPPLRDRRDDIPALALHFAHKAAHRFSLPFVAPTPRDIDLLAAYSWPGNVRELGTVMDRAALLGNGARLDVATALGFTSPHPADATSSILSGTPTKTLGSENAMGSQVLSLDLAMKLHIEQALRAARGRIEGPHGAARMLGINPHTLRARMRKLKVDWRQYRESSGAESRHNGPPIR